MTRMISSLVTLLTLITSLDSQTIFLKHEENCMDRLEYASADMNSAYISYSVNLGNKKMLMLDIGKENDKWVKDLPGKLTYCNALKMDRNLAQQVNNGTLKLYIIRETPTQYNISLVDKAIYYEQNGNVVDFTAEDADFVFSTDNLMSDVNLSKPTSKMQVYLDGTLKVQCATGYILSKKESLRSMAYKEYVLIPDIGIVEKSSVSDAGQVSRLKLNKVGNNAYQSVISAYCDKMQATYYDGVTNVPTSYGDLASKGQGIPASYGNDPCAPSQVGGIHVVQKGETLYGISRRYGVTLDQLRSWNKIDNANIISLCQQLFVREPSTVSGTTSTTPAPATTTEKGGSATTGQAYWINAPQVHVVRPGESVAGLANMYGYNEERFRKMNGLGVTEQIYAGQKLRTSDCVCPTLESTTKDQPLPYEAETAALTAKGSSDVYFRPVKVHQVQASETLFSIAKLYDTTVERILELNGMKKGESVKTNQRIYVQ